NVGQTKHRPVLSGISITKEPAAIAPANLNSRETHAQTVSAARPEQPDGSQFSIQTQTIPQTANASAMHEKMPDYLGTLSIKKGMTVWQVLETVYGNNGQELTRRLAEMNPQIKNMDFM